MKNITIKSVTHCPTCNSECKVNGGTTQYYVPVKKYTEEDMLKAFEKGALYGSTKNGNTHYFDEIIKSLNKQD